ncbi:MAG: hypothetical protein JNL50_10130 [Phycisphaerae bacterium]|nr:hypothetical protein [Phycisphaerae bacterium]
MNRTSQPPKFDNRLFVCYLSVSTSLLVKAIDNGYLFPLGLNAWITTAIAALLLATAFLALCVSDSDWSREHWKSIAVWSVTTVGVVASYLS